MLTIITSSIGPRHIGQREVRDWRVLEVQYEHLKGKKLRGWTQKFRFMVLKNQCIHFWCLGNVWYTLNTLPFQLQRISPFACVHVISHRYRLECLEEVVPKMIFFQHL